MEIKGLPVRKVLVDEAAAIEQEIYFSITNDRAAKKPVMIASAAGGVDIEEVAATTPEKIIKVHIDPLLGLRDYQARDIAASIDLPRELWRDFSKIASGLWRAYLETDATLAEINPLVITKDKRLVALDGKMMIDDNALFRHPDLAEMRDIDEEAPAETEARKYGLSFIKLDGRHRLHGQRRRAGHDQHGHRQTVRRRTSQLPGYRRRRGRRKSSRCDAHHPF